AQLQADSVLKSIFNAAASNDEVSLAGFGKFKVKASPEREGHNPANGEKIKIAASKKLSFLPRQGSEGHLERLNTEPRLIAHFWQLGSSSFTDFEHAVET